MVIQGNAVKDPWMEMSAIKVRTRGTASRLALDQRATDRRLSFKGAKKPFKRDSTAEQAFFEGFLPCSVTVPAE